MYYTSTDFGGASSSRFPVRANRNLRLRLGFGLLTFGSVHAKVLPWTDYMATDIGADSSSHFPFRPWMYKQTDKQTDR